MADSDIPAKSIAASELLQQVSRIRYRGSDLYFGKEAINRYDDPSRSYGVLYLAFDLATGLMETVFHKHAWRRRKKRSVSFSELQQRTVRAVGTLEPLVLADLSAPDVMASVLGLTLTQMASRRYLYTQRVSASVHGIKDTSDIPRFDGILYPSRNNHPAVCVALFERAQSKVDLVDEIDLLNHRDWPIFKEKYQIVILTA